MDHPEYLELKKRNRWVAFLWMFADIGYYFGLLGALLAPMVVLLNLVLRWLRGDLPSSIWRALLLAPLFFAAFALIFLLSASLKVYASKKGRTYNACS